MLSKDQLLSEIRQALQSGSVEKKDLVSVINEATHKKHASLPHILGYIGGGIVLIGIIIYIGQQWASFGSFMRIFFTLITGIILYVVAWLLHKVKRTQVVSMGMFLASYGLIPGGVAVLLHETGTSTRGIMAHLIVALITCMVTVVTFILLRNTFLLLTAILGTTWLYYAILTWMEDLMGPWQSETFGYLTAMQGLSFVLLGYVSIRRWKYFENLKGLLYLTGSYIFMGALLAVSFEHEGLLYIYWAFIGACIFASISLNSKALLSAGSVFLVAYIIRITAEYFAKSIGWPIALIFIGIAIIIISILSVKIGKKYLTRNKNSATVSN